MFRQLHSRFPAVAAALLALSACGGLAWNTTVADSAATRAAMLASLRPGVTTETAFITRWGRPTQKVREGAETRLVYRNMENPPGYRFPQFGDSSGYVVAVFQHGLATGGYSSDTEGCRATFPPRPPGPGFDNPATVHPVNCATASGAFPPPPIRSDDPLPAPGKL